MADVKVFERKDMRESWWRSLQLQTCNTYARQQGLGFGISMIPFLKELYKDDEEAYKTWLHLFPLISSIINYSEEVEHLDLLVDSFYTYHKPEKELQIDDKKEDE